MKLDLLKYKILLDNKSDSVINKISGYKKYGFNESDLPEILFVLTDEIVIYGYNNFCNNISYELIKLLEKKLKKYLTVQNENRFLCLMWIQIFELFFECQNKYYETISRLSQIEQYNKQLEERITDLENQIKFNVI